MPGIVVLGGGVIGLATAAMLARQGHDVTVLERDPQPVPGSPDEAVQDWDRRGVAQFRLPHYLHPGGRLILDEYLPEVTKALTGAGAASFDTLALMPPVITDRAPREGDGKFVTVTGRRPVTEYAVATVAEQAAGVRRGVHVTGLLTGTPVAPGVPDITGVRTSDGQEIAADLVIDAMGRRSPLPAWLAAIGAQSPEEEQEDSGFTYYTRYFRPVGAAPPPFRAGLLTHFDCFSLLTLPGDCGVWSVTIYISSRDQALKRLREPGPWAALVASCPLHAHLLDGEPVTGLVAMSGIVDRYRRLAVDGTPVATGIVAVGDSSMCTNPSLGRGITMGLMQAAGTAGVVREQLGDPMALARAHDKMTQATVTPWYRHTVGLDRARRDQVNASISGDTSPARPAPARAQAAGQALQVAAMADAGLFRALSEIIGMLAAPAEVLRRPGLAERALAAADGQALPAPPGPSRAEVLRMLA
ncbi:MAG: FAD-dependent oxidoreductase [Nocardiopsaceae bacterium]|jgi:2-polyprenyl-6-methoxyphenol hydroxylase-like FAD-dependent oxidoreductase|nr:FAD-dependent oxidoreductase [Nocardiopsaceae bacterium]